jgi:hypothetical protein
VSKDICWLCWEEDYNSQRQRCPIIIDRVLLDFLPKWYESMNFKPQDNGLYLRRPGDFEYGAFKLLKELGVELEPTPTFWELLDQAVAP